MHAGFQCGESVVESSDSETGSSEDDIPLAQLGLYLPAIVENEEEIPVEDVLDGDWEEDIISEFTNKKTIAMITALTTSVNKTKTKVKIGVILTTRF